MNTGMGPTMSGPGWMPSAPPTLARLPAWHPQPIPVFPAGCLLAAALYLLAVRHLRRRGDAWPPGRTVAFLAGLSTILAVTATGIGAYGMEMLSVHMVQHLALSMICPVLLLLGAPITLTLRALHPAAPGTPVRANTWYTCCTHARPRS